MINTSADKVIKFLESPEKSTVTLFTPEPAQANLHPQVKLHEQVVPLEKQPKLLGVTFDTMFRFSKHIEIAVNRGKTRNNILKALAGSTWGQDQETLVSTYKSICRSVLEYGVQIWSPIISETNWKKLQTCQNQALRIATGNLAMAAINHLHQETKVLPIKDHGKMITVQHLLTCNLPGHPGNRLLDRPDYARNQRLTLLSSKPEIEHLLPITGKRDLKEQIQTVHTSTVKKVIRNYQPNKVLQRKPPSKINKEEKDLPRAVRCKLSQWRSNYSRDFNSYLSRIDQSDTVRDTCPKCSGTPHDTNHQFNCPSMPTELKNINLWTKPKKVAEFFKLGDGIT